MITPSETPFSVSFLSGNSKNWLPMTFVTDEKLLLSEEPSVTVEENRDLTLRFRGREGFLFTMDGLELLPFSGAVQKEDDTYLSPTSDRGLLLFAGQNFPLVPGYYVITVLAKNQKWYGLLEIKPRFLGKQSWEAMRDELAQEIKELSFDFIKRSTHISKAMEGALGIQSSLLLRFYTLSNEFSVVLHALDELSRTANARPVLAKKRIRLTSEEVLPNPRPLSYCGNDAAWCTYTTITRDLPENRFVKVLLEKLDTSLRFFMEEVDKHIESLTNTQESIARYKWDRDISLTNKGLNQFLLFKHRAKILRQSIKRVESSSWYQEAKVRRTEEIPQAVFLDPRYSVLYRLHHHLDHPEDSLMISSFYQFQWKRTDKLYELWGFLQFMKSLVKNGFSLQEGMAVTKAEGRYKLNSLDAGTTLWLARGNERISLTYDGEIPKSSDLTTRFQNPIFSNNPHRRPDLRLDYYTDELYLGSLVADFKYRDLLFLWEDEEKSAALRMQFNAYRDVNTRFYRDKNEVESIRDSRPVKEVWAVFPRNLPPQSDVDYSLKFLPLAPGLESNEKLGELLENYLDSLQ